MCQLSCLPPICSKKKMHFIEDKEFLYLNVYYGTFSTNRFYLRLSQIGFYILLTPDPIIGCHILLTPDTITSFYILLTKVNRYGHFYARACQYWTHTRDS